jgi:hypothetical protein
VRALELTGGVLAAGAVPALAVSSTTYRGRTSQRLPVAIVVSRERIERLTITWSAQCHALHAALKGITTYHEGVALKKSAWSTWGTYGARVAGGYQEQFLVRDHGTFAGSKRIQGVFTGTVQIYRGSKHKRIDTCESGEVTFTLTRAR